MAEGGGAAALDGGGGGAAVVAGGGAAVVVLGGVVVVGVPLLQPMIMKEQTNRITKGMINNFFNLFSSFLYFYIRSYDTPYNTYYIMIISVLGYGLCSSFSIVRDAD